MTEQNHAAVTAPAARNDDDLVIMPRATCDPIIFAKLRIGNEYLAVQSSCEPEAKALLNIPDGPLTVEAVAELREALGAFLQWAATSELSGEAWQVDGVRYALDRPWRGRVAPYSDYLWQWNGDYQFGVPLMEAIDPPNEPRFLYGPLSVVPFSIIMGKRTSGTLYVTPTARSYGERPCTECGQTIPSNVGGIRGAAGHHNGPGPFCSVDCWAAK
jgi:hypothetical protein